MSLLPNGKMSIEYQPGFSFCEAPTEVGLGKGSRFADESPQFLSLFHTSVALAYFFHKTFISYISFNFPVYMASFHHSDRFITLATEQI